MQQHDINIKLKEGITEKLYIEITCHSADNRQSKAIIAGSHTRFIYIENADGEVELDLASPQKVESASSPCARNVSCESPSPNEDDDIRLNLKMVH